VGSGIPYVLENVSRAPLDGVTLCGAMFGLRFADGSPLYRHRLFESSVFMLAPGHPRHHETLEPGRMLGSRGRRINGRDPGGDVMGTPWMTAEERAQAIPPAYTEWIGLEVLHRLGVPA
jgi:DNA (cytosine-5)-methyltransferase 1